MRSFPKYNSYKDSGIPWLGEIPEHWKVIRNIGLFDERKQVNQPNMELLSVTINQGIIKQREITEKKDSSNEDKRKYKVVEKGDLAYNKMRMWQGAIGVSDYDGIVSPAYIVLKPREHYASKFFHYLYRTNKFINEANRHSYGLCDDMNSLRYEHFKTIYSIVPPKREILKIVIFLDRKTGEIDDAITKKERLIELLKEEKSIIINQAVTKGLNPNAPMKDSGIKWIGKIPKHWEVKRLRYIGHTQNGISAGAEYFGAGYPFVNYGDVYSNRELPKTVKGLAKSPDKDRVLYSVKNGDVFFTRTSETIEEIGFSSTCLEEIPKATFSGFLIRFRPMKSILEPVFSKFYFSANIHRAFFIKEMNLVIRASLSQELLKRLPVLIPPMREQIEIAKHIEEKSAEIANLIDKTEQEIEKLKELKSVLISEAVTGKIKV